MNTVTKLNSRFPFGYKIIRWVFRIIVFIVAAIVILLLVGFSYDTITAKSDFKRYPPPGVLIDVGDFKLQLYCTGERLADLPTVILEAGSGSASPDWGLVQPEIAKITRVCSYDRAGLMWSEPGPLPRNSLHYAEELHTLLTKAGEDGPYLLVGHSLGGHTVRLFAYQYPQDVIGIILVDARPEGMISLDASNNASQMSFWVFMARCGLFRLVGKTMLPPQILEKMPDYPWPIMFRPKFFETARDEDVVESDKQVLTAGSLGAMPLIVISHSIPDLFAYLPADQILQVEEDWQKEQMKLASLSSNGKYTLADESGHYIQIDRPDIVIDAIKRMITPVP